ncbi:Ig-like domain-containing protein [Alkalimonas sp. NCh-2]|uniref:Ig-like domain-containing protein n=1 Tax=Alkalimonas sp. NCh-2 TaxID=3144846 RepID=UPI0031F6B36F
MTFLRSMLMVIGLASLVACNSDNSGLNEISINAELDQGAQWQQQLELGQFPSVLSAPEHGHISLNSSQVTYTPEASFRGTDQARVEGRSAVYVFTFLVRAVNQPPQLINTSIEVIATREIEGQLEVYDQDGDEISFELLQPPERGEFTLEQNGYFHYQLADLALPNASFTVAISDGVNDPVQETVTLLPAYGTNEEKSAYYYFSNHSHLLQAEQRLRQIDSDTDTEAAYSVLAEGYVIASMDDEVQRISDQFIRSQEGRARHALALARLYQARGNTDTAAALRRQAFDTFTQMTVDNGIDNMRGTDAQFYLTMQRHAQEIGDANLVERINAQVRTFIGDLGGGVYKNAHGYIANTLRGSTFDYLEEMQADDSQLAFELAMQNVHALSYLVEVGGYHEFTNRPTHYRIPPLHSIWAAELYYFLGEFEAAKRQLAYTMSFYGHGDYDPNYTFADKPYAEATLEEYPIPLQLSAAYFSVLYPDADTNLPLSLLDEGSTPYTRAQAEIDRIRFVLRVLEGEPAESVIDDLLEHFTGPVRTQMNELTELSSSNLYFGSTLRLLGYTAEADLALERAYQLMLTPEFAAQNGHSPQYHTGTSGCFKIVNQTLRTGNRDLAQSRARSCEDLLGSATGQLFSHVTNVIQTYLHVGLDNDGMSLYEQALHALESEREPGLEQASSQLLLARLLAYGREYERALIASEAGIEQLSSATYSNNLELRNIINALGAFTRTDGMRGINMPADTVLVELRSHAYNHPNYQQWMLHLNELIASQLTRLNHEVLQHPAPEHAGFSRDLVEALSYARRYGEAEQTIRDMSLGEAERIQLLSRISAIQAVQDDYPASLIATVDTDLDGRANFFAVAATVEQLSETDIELDDDADGDGVKDEDDPQPLG